MRLIFIKEEIESYEKEWDIKFPDEMIALFKYFSYFEGPDFRIPYKCTVNDIFGIEFTDDYSSVDERKDWDFSFFIPISTWKD